MSQLLARRVAPLHRASALVAPAPAGVPAASGSTPPVSAAPPLAPRPSRAARTRRWILRVVALDAVLILLAMALAWPLRGLVPGVPAPTAGGLLLAALVAPVIWATWLVLLALYGAYHRRIFAAGAEEFRRVVQAGLIAGLLTSTACHFTELPLSRGFLAGTFLIGGVLLVAERYAMRKLVQRALLGGELAHRVLLVGSPGGVNGLAPTLERSRYLGYDVVACTLSGPVSSAPLDLPAPAAGTVADIGATCDRLAIDTVMVAGGADLDLREIAWSIEGRDIDLVVVPRLADVSGTRLHMRPVAGLPLLHVEEPQASQAGEWPKRVFDLLGAGFALLVLSPLMLAVALMVKLSDGGPVFYRQARVGLHGRTFGCWKFRSMVVDADRALVDLRREHGCDEGIFKLKEDPRVTRVGRFIRRYSIDELPQLFNVIQGSMSLVGPRPHLPVEVETYNDRARRRLHVRPGMTGLWQVSGRSDLSWDDAVRLDLYYRDNWSMVGDLIIMAKTLRAVVGANGAY